MIFRAYIDNDIRPRGRVVVELFDEDYDDRELLFKLPFLLRIRIKLAAKRLQKRHRKMVKANKALDKMRL